MNEQNNDNTGTLVAYAMHSLLIGLLTIAFTVLKLCGVVAWSWWWVLAPIWISAGALVLLLLVALLLVWMGRNLRGEE